MKSTFIYINVDLKTKLYLIMYYTTQFYQSRYDWKNFT